MRIIETKNPKFRDYSKWLFKNIEHKGTKYKALHFYIDFNTSDYKTRFTTYLAYNDNTLDENNYDYLDLICSITGKSVYELFLYMITGELDSKCIKSKINVNIHFHRGLSVSYGTHVSYELENIRIYFYEFYKNMCLFYNYINNNFYILTKFNKVLTNKDKERFKMLNLKESKISLLENSVEFNLYKVETNKTFNDIVSSNKTLKNNVIELKDKLTEEGIIFKDSNDVFFNANKFINYKLLKNTYNELSEKLFSDYVFDKEMFIDLNFKTILTDLTDVKEIVKNVNDKFLNDLEKSFKNVDTIPKMYRIISDLDSDLSRIASSFNDNERYRYIKVVDKNTNDVFILAFEFNSYKTNSKIYYELFTPNIFCLKIKNIKELNKYFNDINLINLEDLTNKNITFDICEIEKHGLDKKHFYSEETENQTEVFWQDVINSDNIKTHINIGSYVIKGYGVNDYLEVLTEYNINEFNYGPRNAIITIHSFLVVKDLLEIKEREKGEIK